MPWGFDIAKICLNFIVKVRIQLIARLIPKIQNIQNEKASIPDLVGFNVISDQ